MDKNLTKILENLTEEEKMAKQIFFGVLGNYSCSTELITTWLGREPQEGGKIVIGWNTLNKLVWKCIGIAKGIEEIPQEIKKLLKDD